MVLVAYLQAHMKDHSHLAVTKSPKSASPSDVLNVFQAIKADMPKAIYLQ